jgi:4-hydroxybenzoate polyprenyltransferase
LTAGEAARATDRSDSHGLLQKARAHIRLMRPYAWLWFDTLPAIVMYSLLAPAPVDPRRFFTGLLAIICADASVTTLNDVCDVETDRASAEPSRNQRPIVIGLVSKRAALGQVGVLATLSLMLAFTVDSLFMAAVAWLILLGITYSAPPLRFSSRPLTALPFWVGCHVSFYLAIAALARKLYTTDSVLWLLGALLFMAIAENMAKDLRDWENDTEASKMTTVVALGPRLSAIISLVGCLAGTSLYLTLLWTHSELALWARLLPSLLLLLWMGKVIALVSSLVRKYSKSNARLLHRGYILAYLTFSVLVAIGLSPRIAMVLSP